MNELNYFASGKLLLFGEYLVLRGAKSITIPLRFGQSLTISSNTDEKKTIWQSFDHNSLWLEIALSPELDIIRTTNRQAALIVQKLLKIIRKEKPGIEITGKNFRFDTDFDRNYGFGTSSTFLSLLSQWSGVNPYLLQESSFGGSGFDIAAATASGLFVYQTSGPGKDAKRTITPSQISEEITSRLLFVFTGKKQKSQAEVSGFKNSVTTREQIVEMNTIVDNVLRCTDIAEFDKLMNQSECLISGTLNTVTVKDDLFQDYPFAVKSLGAWGGDFVMATFRDENLAREYFLAKEMNPIFNYRQLIKQ